MHYLDTPPPTSNFRRPWSPDPYDPLPSTSRGGQTNEHVPQLFNNNYPHHSTTSHIHREGSDASVDALDLADYARTLQARQAEEPYPPFSPLNSHLPSSMRPFASRDSFQPPSLVSRGETLSSSTHSSTSRTRNSHNRPFSLPPPVRHSSASSRRLNASPYPPEPQIQSQDQNINLSHFPPWSRSWYKSNNSIPTSPPDIYTPLPASQFGFTKNSPFDPGYVHKERFSDPYPYNYAPTSSLGHDSTRDLLPWSNDPPDHDTIDSSTKEERIRMLEREFGPKAKGKGRDNDPFLDENGKPLVGTVDEKGYLVTQGPKKRTAIRVLQILMAFAASIPAIYAALAIKPKETPPPAAKPPAFVLYILSVLTLLILLYLFVARPCFCSGKRQKNSSNTFLPGGMMVLPVQGLPGKKAGKKPKGGKKGKGGNIQGDVQVNLIVDPEAFGRRDDEISDDEDDEWEGSFPGTYETGSGRRKKRRARRRGVFAGLAMEEDWKRARAWAKKIALFDGVGVVLWGATFVYILIGKRCPSGAFDGWCNAYNVSSAAACILCVAFGISVFFDVKDLHASKTSPRTRT